MGSEKQEQTLTWDGYNQPTETSGSGGITQTKTTTETRRYSGRYVHVDTSKRSFKGEQPGISAVLVTRTNNIENKVKINIFCEKLGNYILREITNTSEVVCVVRDMKCPIKYSENNHKPNLMSIHDLKDSINTEIQKHQLKNYVNREAVLRSNLENIYDHVWGQ